MRNLFCASVKHGLYCVRTDACREFVEYSRAAGSLPSDGAYMAFLFSISYPHDPTLSKPERYLSVPDYSKIMLLAHFAGLCFSIITIFSAALPQPSQDHSTGLSAGSVLPSQLLYPGISSLNATSAENKITISCDGPRYGQNLRVTSCREIFRFIAKADHQTTFGERGSQVTYQAPLPYRLQSREFEDL